MRELKKLSAEDRGFLQKIAKEQAHLLHRFVDNYIAGYSRNNININKQKLLQELLKN